MSELIAPGAGVLYMKVGTHANEPLENIIGRKTKEIDDAGHALWGYGGNTCHPQTMVQPFAKSFARRRGAVYLCMQPMQSNHFADQVRAEEFSINGIDWQTISPAINVRGSRYALVIKNLRRDEFVLPLGATRVALGNSAGALGSKYISGRVDKACLEVLDRAALGQGENESVHIGLVAELVAPFAVYVRNLVK